MRTILMAVVAAFLMSAAGWDAITHMGWSIPIETVRSFLRDAELGYIIGDPEIEPEEPEELAE